MSAQLNLVSTSVSNEPDTRTHRFERDLTMIFEKEGEYETVAHGMRFRFRIAERDGREGKYLILLPLSLEHIYFERGRLVVDEVVYSRRHDDRYLSIPVTRLTGRGTAYPQRGRYDPETQELLGFMERLTLAGMAWSVREFVAELPQIRRVATSDPLPR